LLNQKKNIMSQEQKQQEPFKLPDLPWAKDAFVNKGISKETIEYHYGKHHAGYVRKLNTIANDDKNIAKQSLEEIIQTGKGGAYNNAAQIWNHTFYWNCMSPNENENMIKNYGAIETAIQQRFNGIDKFEQEFKTRATNHFASGWVWLVYDAIKDNVEIIEGHDAENPLKNNMHPLLTIDVWEHAYYIDYRNDRAAYINTFWKLINWEFVNQNYTKCQKKK